ncbi:hypothetical protein AVEN_213408-1 [Araneus ventricosus]|uniref:RNA-directed DNA polymerase n=1 Tax=Araneus ventricosus TaxID=182803 RepID=A0A4Y2N4Z3_ARAVE|nr:hypothetical protein AVEN_213408-1 [Araneus ventricosus]
MSIQDLIKNQEEDHYSQNIKDKLKSGFVFAQKSPVFFIRDDLLLFYKNSGDQHAERAKLVFPKSSVPLVLNSCHDSKAVAHAGFSRTLKRVKSHFFWHNFYGQVKDYVASCHSCIQRRGFNKNQKVPIEKMPIPNFPFQRVSFDAIGPFQISAYGNKYLIVITDTFTKHSEVYPVPDIQS